MKNTSFRCLWIGQAFANLGDIFYVVGLISLLYTITGSAFYLSLLPFTTTIFRFFSSLLAPLVIDRFPLKRILVQSQWWKTILLVCLGIYITNFNHGFSVAVIFFIALISLLDGVTAPVSAALVPQLVPKDERMKANGFLNVITQTIFVAGGPLGSRLIDKHQQQLHHLAYCHAFCRFNDLYCENRNLRTNDGLCCSDKLGFHYIRMGCDSPNPNYPYTHFH
ncbi:MFS transporter [Peribacillus simplex]|uniref:MFS transporter n=1 Tax=Peribacillus simplex TaxID=1478 RepID=UPI003671C360